MKIYMTIIKLLKQNLGVKSCKQLFKTLFPNFYYQNLHLNDYKFC